MSEPGSPTPRFRRVPASPMTEPGSPSPRFRRRSSLCPTRSYGRRLLDEDSNHHLRGGHCRREGKGRSRGLSEPYQVVAPSASLTSPPEVMSPLAAHESGYLAKFFGATLMNGHGDDAERDAEASHSLQSLPFEILSSILYFLSAKELSRCACTCRVLWRVASGHPAWQRLVLLDFGFKYENYAMYVRMNGWEEWRLLYLRINQFVSNLRRGHDSAKRNTFRSILAEPVATKLPEELRRLRVAGDGEGGEDEILEGRVVVSTDSEILLWENGRVVQVVDVREGLEMWRIPTNLMSCVSPPTPFNTDAVPFTLCRPCVVNDSRHVFIHHMGIIFVRNLRTGALVKEMTLPPLPEWASQSPLLPAASGTGGTGPVISRRGVRFDDLAFDLSIRNSQLAVLSPVVMLVWDTEELELSFAIYARSRDSPLFSRYRTSEEKIVSESLRRLALEEKETGEHVKIATDPNPQFDFMWAGYECRDKMDRECPSCHGQSRSTILPETEPSSVTCIRKSAHVVAWLRRKSPRIRVYRAKNGEYLCSLLGHQSPIIRVRQSVNLKRIQYYYLISLAQCGEIRIWDASSPGFNCIQRLPPETDMGRGGVFRVQLTPHHFMTLSDTPSERHVRLKLWRFCPEAIEHTTTEPSHRSDSLIHQSDADDRRTRKEDHGVSGLGDWSLEDETAAGRSWERLDDAASSAMATSSGIGGYMSGSSGISTFDLQDVGTPQTNQQQDAAHQPSLQQQENHDTSHRRNSSASASSQNASASATGQGSSAVSSSGPDVTQSLPSSDPGILRDPREASFPSNTYFADLIFDRCSPSISRSLHRGDRHKTPPPYERHSSHAPLLDPQSMLDAAVLSPPHRRASSPPYSHHSGRRISDSRTPPTPSCTPGHSCSPSTNRRHANSKPGVIENRLEAPDSVVDLPQFSGEDDLPSSRSHGRRTPPPPRPITETDNKGRSLLAIWYASRLDNEEEEPAAAAAGGEIQWSSNTSQWDVIELRTPPRASSSPRPLQPSTSSSTSAATIHPPPIEQEAGDRRRVAEWPMPPLVQQPGEAAMRGDLVIEAAPPSAAPSPAPSVSRPDANLGRLALRMSARADTWSLLEWKSFSVTPKGSLVVDDFCPRIETTNQTIEGDPVPPPPGSSSPPASPSDGMRSHRSASSS